MSGGKASRDKGLGGEREFCKLYGGERMPLSGAQGGSFTGTWSMALIAARIKRGRGFKTITGWRIMIFIMRADRSRAGVFEMDDLKLLLMKWTS